MFQSNSDDDDYVPSADEDLDYPHVFVSRKDDGL